MPVHNCPWFLNFNYTNQLSDRKSHFLALKSAVQERAGASKDGGWGPSKEGGGGGGGLAILP